MRREAVAIVMGLASATLTNFDASPAAAVPPTGGVCDVSVVAKALSIDCDDQDNNVIVAQISFGSDEFQISSGNGTLFDLSSGPVAGPVLVTGVTGNVEVDMGDGNQVGDLLEVADALIPRDIRISSGEGRNEVLIVDSEIGGTVWVKNGDGGSETDCEGSVVHRDLRYSNADGFDEAKIDGCTVLGRVQVDNGDGSSVLDIESETLIEGDVLLMTGEGETHEVGVEESTILGNVTVMHGDAVETVVEMEAETGTEILIGGNINVDNGRADFHVFELEGAEGEANLVVGGSIHIVNGPGDSEVTLEKDVRVEGNFHHTSGDGFDEFVSELGVGIAGNLRIDHGSGGSETVLTESAIGGTLSVDTGLGSDLLELVNLEVTRTTQISTRADGDAVLVADSTFGNFFAADGGADIDVFEDGGGNAFNRGTRLSNFEVVLP